uniref:Uncharacterized protein n=1 Tax=Nelumbo nucifera TaxID=4432 RepID=A0A822ZZ48_NELNU|nr:TPA_asm: hypothetical protein HUJ06_018582 [Nelumbo nucifera]
MTTHVPERAPSELPESSPQFSRYGYTASQQDSETMNTRTSAMANSFRPSPYISLQRFCIPWQDQSPRVRMLQRSLSMDSPHTPSNWQAELSQQYSDATTASRATPTMASSNSLRQLCTPWQDRNNLQSSAVLNNIRYGEAYPDSPIIAFPAQPAPEAVQVRVPAALQVENYSQVRFRTLQRSLTIGSPHTPSQWGEPSLKQERFKIRGLDLAEESPRLKLERFKVKNFVIDDQGTTRYR